MTDHTPLTDQQLDDIEARERAATKGPWGSYDGETYADVAADLQITGRGSYSYREKVARLEDENYWDDSAHEDDDEERAPEQMAANAAFIAHAREDVPALVAEVRRLREQLAAAVQCNDCGAVGPVFTGDDGLAYLDPTGQIGHPAAVPAAAEGAER